MRVPLGVVAVDLRGAPERDGGLRRAHAEERQRDRPARARATPPARTRRWRRLCERPWPTAELPEGSVELLDERRPERARGAGHRGWTGRPDHPARRRGAEGGAQVGCHRAGDVRGGGELPRVRPRGRRPRDGAAGRLQREGAPPGVCNAAETLLVDAAVADRVPAGRSRGSPRGRRGARGRRAGPARRRGRRRLARRPRRTGTPSTSDMRMAVGRRGLARRRDRARERARHGAFGGDRDLVRAMRPRSSRTGSTRRSST